MLVCRLGIALAVYVGVSACAQAATCPTANEVRSETKRVGPKATLDAAYADTKRWNCVLEGIESTSPSWLSIASSLRSASDAGASSELGVALVNAFEKNPSAVLAVTPKEAAPGKLSVQTVCNPAIEPPQGYRAFFDQIEVKLVALKAESLGVKKERCLDIVRRARLALVGASK